MPFHGRGASKRKDGQRAALASLPRGAIEAWRVLRVPLCLYKRRMRRLARERGGERERKSDNGDGGSLLCVITTRARQPTRGGSISAREYKALKIALMNPGVLNARAVFWGEISGVNHA